MSLDFFKAVFLTTLGQLIAVLGVFFLLGFLLYFLARFTRTTFVRSVGSKADVVWTGWLGTPVHELGHALFCIVFGHRIVEMKLYDPEPGSGSLGYVNHSYNPKNIYHKIGNFFIGAGPIILGSFVLYAAMYYLLPNHQAIFRVIDSGKLSLQADLSVLVNQVVRIFEIGKNTVALLVHPQNLQSWTFWLFIYLSVCIASHMELSPPDLKGMWSGLGTQVIMLLILNFVSMLFGFNLNKYIMIINGYTGMFTGLFVFAVIVSAANFIVSYFVLAIYLAIRQRRFLNPLF